MEAEQRQLLAEPPVIAPAGLFESREMLFERRAVGERGSVDALQHRIALVAAPVGAGNVRQLDGPSMPVDGT